MIQEATERVIMTLNTSCSLRNLRFLLRATVVFNKNVLRMGRSIRKVQSSLRKESFGFVLVIGSAMLYSDSIREMLESSRFLYASRTTLKSIMRRRPLGLLRVFMLKSISLSVN